VVELITADRPGLLSRIGRAFQASGVRLQNAKVATFGARAEDSSLSPMPMIGRSLMKRVLCNYVMRCCGI